MFYVDTVAERDALTAALQDGTHLAGWAVDLRPLIFSYSPAALDEQIDYTLRAYREQSWEALRQNQRPSYGDPRAEAESAQEI